MLSERHPAILPVGTSTITDNGYQTVIKSHFPLGTYMFFSAVGLTHINLVFRSLYTNPCFSAHLTQIFSRFCKALGEGARRTVSSAYTRWLKHFVLRVHPTVEADSSMLSESMYTLKRVGDKILPKTIGYRKGIRKYIVAPDCERLCWIPVNQQSPHSTDFSNTYILHIEQIIIRLKMNVISHFSVIKVQLRDIR